MSEQLNTEKAGSVLDIVGGVFVGLIAGIIIPVSIFMGIMSATGGSRYGMALAELLNLSVLGFLGYLASQKKEHSSFAQGALIGISITFLLNALCGFMMLGWR